MTVEVGRYYRCGSRQGHPVVRIWVGRICTPEDLGFGPEPVVCVVVRALADDMPTLRHAAIAQSALDAARPQPADPFDFQPALFDESHTAWRTAYDREETAPWEIGPADIYAQMLADLNEALRGKDRAQ